MVSILSDPKKKLVLELVPCVRCGNPFMKRKGVDLKEQVCDNCVKLDQRKRELQIGVINDVIKSNKDMENSIMEMKNQLTVTKSTFNKQDFLNKIKKKTQSLAKSIELIEKIEETKDEKYIDEYKKLFDKLKKDYS